MRADLTAVSGIGDATATVLAESGIKTVGQLSKMSVSGLARVKGFSEAKARSVIAAAQQLIGSGRGPTAAAEATPVTPKAATPSEDEGEKKESEKTKKKGANAKDKNKEGNKGKKGKKGKKRKKGKKGKKNR